MLRSADLIERFPDLDPVRLIRWRENGYIDPSARHRGGRSQGGGGALGHEWPAWTARMVGLLLMTDVPANGNVTANTETRRLLQGVACCLAEHPEVPWAVRIDGGPTVPAWTAEEVAALCADVRLHAEVVAIPSGQPSLGSPSLAGDTA